MHLPVKRIVDSTEEKMIYT